MQVFVFEYLTGGGTLQRPDALGKNDSLFSEGLAMLRALVADLVALADVNVTVQLDSRLRQIGPEKCNLRFVSGVQEEVATFRSLASSADWTFVIAPEFDDLLYQRCRLVEEIGGRLLGPSSQAVAILADKLTTARILGDAGVRTPATQLADDFQSLSAQCRFPAVVKPRFGAGSQDVRFVKSLRGFADGGRNDWLVQDFHSGHPVSVATLCGPGQIALLPAVTQLLSDDGRFRYLGGRLPVPDAEEQRAHKLVRAALDVLPSLDGFVGFDLVLGSDSRGTEDVVIEVNPRLTTSYVGLRTISQQNLPAVMLDIALGRSVELSFRREAVEFTPDGSVRCIS